MKILVLNARIYSLEYELLEMPEEKILCSGKVSRIGAVHSIIYHKNPEGKEEKFVLTVYDHKDAIEKILTILISEKIIKTKKDIDAVGHRVVHGGEDFKESVRINSGVRKKIHRNIELAPLHNPYNLKAINAAVKVFSKVPNVAVFDTSFYQKMPAHAYYYAVPMHLYQKYRVRRYGFHGISHQYACESAVRMLKKSIKELKIISFHIDEGCSATAIKDGAPVDTSMGFSPLSGLVMMRRCGNVDPEIVIYLSKLGWNITEIETLLNKKSGVCGISGIGEIQEVVEFAKKGDKRANLALDVFCYSIQKYLFLYYGVLRGANVIIFSGDIGINVPYIREKVLKGTEFLGIKLDTVKNNKVIGTQGRIDAKGSKVKILIVPRNEGILIARETYAKCRKGQK